MRAANPLASERRIGSNCALAVRAMEWLLGNGLGKSWSSKWLGMAVVIGKAVSDSDVVSGEESEVTGPHDVGRGNNSVRLPASCHSATFLRTLSVGLTEPVATRCLSVPTLMGPFEFPNFW